jgi:hypothetical protein
MGAVGRMTTLASGLALLFMPAGALAGGTVSQISDGGYRYVSVTDTIADNLQKGNEAICPGDEPVVGGGASVFGDAYSSRGEINTSNPYDDDGDNKRDDGWEAFIDNINSGDSGITFTVYAVCDKRAAETDYRYRLAPPVSSPEGSQTPSTVLCPGGEAVTAGGVRSSGFLNDEMHVNTLRPEDGADSDRRLDDGFIAWVDNEMVGSPGQQFTAFAICDKRRPDSAYAYRRANDDSPESNSVVLGRTCKAGERIVGGGMRSSGAYADRMFATSAYPFPLLGSQHSYVAAVNNLNGGVAGQTVSAYAICRR